MAIDEKLFSGQCSSVGELKVEHSLSATSKVMPLHAGNAHSRIHHSPRITGKMQVVDKSA